MDITILVVDDEDRYVRLMEANLLSEGYKVLKATNGFDAINLVNDHHPDLLLLDVMMPELDGFQVCQRIREFSSVPIIMVTAKGDEIDRVKGLDVGADDYIVKPYSATEFLARVRAVLRRSELSRGNFNQTIFEHGDLEIDFARAEVHKGGITVFLSATEYRLLLQFAHNVGRVMGSDELLENVWGPEYKEDKEILWVSISRLRQKLEEDHKNPTHILTRPGFGYFMPRIEKH
jgi:DNA-binding response OmpR family regulator